MTFLLADTFTDSLAKLTGEEQKAVKTTDFDLQAYSGLSGGRERDLTNPGKFHRLDLAWEEKQTGDAMKVFKGSYDNEEIARIPLC